MIAEDYIHSYQPNIDVSKGIIVSSILECFKSAVPFFKKAITQPNLKKPLNENKLTQIFIEQLRVQLRKKETSFDVGNQYSDLFFETKGIPDFYFHTLEEGRTAEPLFIVEAKRVPAPSKKNETEYVKGVNNNGGIERFKNEKHGKGLSQCGMLGFLEKENSSFWLAKINDWIKDLANSDSRWSIDEFLSKFEHETNYSYLTSIVRKENKIDLSLHHFWIEKCI